MNDFKMTGKAVTVAEFFSAQSADKVGNAHMHSHVSIIPHLRRESLMTVWTAVAVLAFMALHMSLESRHRSEALEAFQALQACFCRIWFFRGKFLFYHPCYLK